MQCGRDWLPAAAGGLRGQQNQDGWTLDGPTTHARTPFNARVCTFQRGFGLFIISYTLPRKYTLQCAHFFFVTNKSEPGAQRRAEADKQALQHAFDLAGGTVSPPAAQRAIFASTKHTYFC